jgi:hypothetical protein
MSLERRTFDWPGGKSIGPAEAHGEPEVHG